MELTNDVIDLSNQQTDPVYPDFGVAPLTIPDKFKPKDKVVKKKNGKKKIIKEKPMSRNEMIEYFSKLQNDPNANLLIAPFFIQEKIPKFATEDPKILKERRKRVDLLEKIGLAETEDEKQTYWKELEKITGEQKVEGMATIPVPANPNPYKQ